MMRVDGAGGQRPEFPEPNRLKKKKAGSASGAGTAPGRAEGVSETQFKQAFLNSAQAQVTASLDSLMDELTAQGNRLQRSQTFEELDKYKKLIQAFLHKVSHELYHLQEAGPVPTRKGQPVNVIIQRVDDRLDSLAKQVLGRQVRQLNLMQSLDIIRGLLMDLYK